MRKSPKLYLSIGLLAVIVAAAAWFFYPAGINSAEAALAEYQIEKMTCGSCVGNIEKALRGLDGIGSVDVNLTSNRGRVTFDPGSVDSATIAETISAAGYPASLRMELAPREYAALRQQETQLGQQYLAKIGDRLLSRSDFEKLVAERSGGAAGGAQDDQLWASVWQDVLQRELLLSAAEQNQVVVQNGEVDVRLEELRQRHQGLEQLVARRYGGMERFRERLREDLVIERNLEDHVYAGLSDPRNRQAKLQEWYSGLQKNTEVVIFDPRIKSLSQGGGCCGGKGGGCGSSNS